MKNRQVSLIVGGAVGAFLIAMIGVSAHTTGLSSFLNATGVHQTASNDEASGARTEPSEKPEATEPAEKPEATPTARPTAKPETEPDSDDAPKATPTSTCSTGEDGGGDDGNCETHSGGGD